jgi:ribonuclease J
VNPRLTCHGGVGEIGGNKFLLEDRDTRVLLDFGTGFSEELEYFDSWIQPRQVNGAGDLFEFGMLPEMEGMYSEKALQNTEVKHKPPEIDAVVLSHYHSDHFGRIGFLHEDIPLFCGETCSLIDQAYGQVNRTPLQGRKVTNFRTGDRFKVGSIEFVPVHVDHSIPGAYGFVIHMSEGTLAYTGDFRFHGPASQMTLDFMEAARDSEPDFLLTEGTRVRTGERDENMSEKGVLEGAKEVVKSSDGLVLSTFRGNDTDRIVTFYDAASSAGRRLVVSMKVALLLEKLSGDPKLRLPRPGKDVDIFARRKKSGRWDDKDYFKWEKPFLNRSVSSDSVRKKEKEFFLHLEVMNFPDLIDISPSKGGTYIHSATEAFNEEGEREEAIVGNWIRHFGFSYHQLHASGHAPKEEVGRLIKGIQAKSVIPIHTEEPELFTQFKQGQEWRLRIPKKGEGIPLA